MSHRAVSWKFPASGVCSASSVWFTCCLSPWPRLFRGLSAVPLQGAGRHEEADDEGTAAAAQEGRVPAEERKAEERPHPQDLPECRGGGNAPRLRGHISRRRQRGLKRPSALLRNPVKLLAPHSDVQQPIFCC